MKRISIEDLKKEQTANKLYKEAKQTLHTAWELAKTKSKYNKEVEAKFQEFKSKLAEADALISSRPSVKELSL